MHDTPPPRIPEPGDAPCADARTTAPTDDSTDALHAAEGSVPDGMLKDTDTVSTTVDGGIDDTDGLSEDDTDTDALLDSVALLDDSTDALTDVDAVSDSVCEEDTLIESVTLAEDATDDVPEGDIVMVGDGVARDEAVTLDDMLDED